MSRKNSEKFHFFCVVVDESGILPTDAEKQGFWTALLSAAIDYHLNQYGYDYDTCHNGINRAQACQSDNRPSAKRADGESA